MCDDDDIDMDSLRPPAHRSECFASPRPCRKYLCQHHMVWLVTAGMRKKPLVDWPMTCAIDTPSWSRYLRPGHPNIEADGSLYEIARVIGVSRERIRQIEASAIKKIQKIAKLTDRLGKLRGRAA